MEAQVDKKTRSRRRGRHNKSKSPEETTTVPSVADHKDNNNPAGDVDRVPKEPTIKVRYRKPKDESRSSKVMETEHQKSAAGAELSQEDIDDWLNMFEPSVPQTQTAVKPKKRVNRQRKRPDAKPDFHSNQRTEHFTAAGAPAKESPSIQTIVSIRAKQPNTTGSLGPKITIIRPPKGPKPQRKLKTSFLSLPQELRDMIYEMSIDLSGITKNAANEHQGFFKGMKSIDSQHQPKRIIKLFRRLALRHGNLRTPTVFLINRQIHDEAQLILRKRSIVFEAPAINDATHLPLYQMVSQYLMRKVKTIHFVMAMKQHTDETMAGELEIGSNWFCHHTLANECLNYSLSWFHFLQDIIAMFWVPGASVQHIVFSITGGKAGDRSYILRPTQVTLNGLDKMLTTCVKTRKLEHFLAYLEYAETPPDL